MGQKLPHLKPNTTIPGPGAYDSTVSQGNLETAKSIRFGKEMRSSLESPNAKIVPGPGTHSPDYKVLKNDSPRFGFGSSQRQGMAKTFYVPGPGQYKLGQIIGKDGPQNSIHSKLKGQGSLEKIIKTPGPGAYESHVNNRRKAPSYGLGSEPRKFGGTQKSFTVPGSNTYNPSADLTQSSAAKWGFGSQERKGPIDMKRAFAPGPGNYEIKSKAFNSQNPRFFLGQKLSPLKPNTTVPGAGAYNPSP